ncbi:MAG: 4Fe-4S dicluster domain-containing protein [Candidatus Lokiarchaeota archaeon]|nr:4Fe-4S dicluster domain-containing protein [Candidatus Lokiarchaeota archaeon]
MPIKGIDKEKCSNCQQCVLDCVASNFILDENKQVQFNPMGCIGCGHCISICPEDAILYKGMRDDPFTFEGIEDPSSIISYDTFQKFIRAKRSIRQYKKEKVPNELIEKVFNSMRYAPTGGNIRGLKCMIISDNDRIKTLSEAILNALLSSSKAPAAYVGRLKSKSKRGYDPIFYDAPHVMIFYSNSSQGFDQMNSTIAITYGMFSAQTLGLGTCWVGFAQSVLGAKKDIRKNIAKIPGTVHAVFVLGYPKVKYHRAAPRPKIRTKGLK